MSTMPIPLEENWAFLSQEEQEVAQLLIAAGQASIFSGWEHPGLHDGKKRKLLEQAKHLNAQYPGGLKQYVDNARKLLKQSFEGDNPFEGWTPSVPSGARLAFGTDEFMSAEARGLSTMGACGFVLVAGGLGERLGYNGIKIELPAEISSGMCYLELYISHILAFQTDARKRASNPKLTIPLAIMTSDDTHSQTVNLLEMNNSFGMASNQITLMKQDKVPSLKNNEAEFAMDDTYTISTKPHGHGDVHILMMKTGTLKKWVDQGVEWISFFQDTNALVFRALPATLGISAARSFAVNSLTVPRAPSEAMGAICALSHTDGRRMTCNVEYNQLDALLKGTINPEGDVADKSGMSPYPGNVNVLIFNAPSYLAVLQRTGGQVPEFVNPKYADAGRTTFKKPTRLECMMQDYPKLLGPDVSVGFTQLDRWMSFAAVKNNLTDGVAKLEKTGFSETASEDLLRNPGSCCCPHCTRSTVWVHSTSNSLKIHGTEKCFHIISIDTHTRRRRHPHRSFITGRRADYPHCTRGARTCQTPHRPE
eukprot:847070_1